MADPFRTVVVSCELCGVEVAERALVDFVGTRACAGCRDGELDRAVARWGLTCNVRENQTGESLYRSVEVLRPTLLDLVVKLDREQPKGWLRRAVSGDPAVGDPEFDDHVLVAPADLSFTAATVRALRSPGVHQAILEVTEQGAAVELAGRSVWVYASEHGGSETIPELAVIQPLAIALAVALERYACRRRDEPLPPSRRCGICGRVVDSPALLAGLTACQRCAVWDRDRPQLGSLTCTTRHDEPYSRISVKSLSFDDYVLFERDNWLKRKLGRGDVEVGDPAFDQNVHVRSTAGSFLSERMARSLENEGVRQGILELLEMAGRGGSVEVAGHELIVKFRQAGTGADLDEALVTVKPLAVALALAINRAG